MKTHYDPYSEDPERGSCGVWLGESSNITGDWSEVTCIRCIAARDRIDNSVENTEKIIVDQMGGMADFFREQENTDG